MLVAQGVSEADDLVVLGLARGGLPVAAEVADAVSAPLDVLVVRKLGVPYQPEYGFGAIAENETLIVDEETVALSGLDVRTIERVRDHESGEVSRRAKAYRAGRPLIDLHGKDVVIVDDGLATGVTMRAAVAFVKAHDAARVTVAVPVAAPESIEELQADADVVCLLAPSDFGAVGYWYRDFRPPKDDEIRSLLTSHSSAGA
jgi:predicted phosphoribosyltransferase